MKILVIENTPAYRDILSAWLAEWGHEVVMAGEGIAGIGAFGASRPDIVLLEMAMPDIDGLETVRRIRALGGSWVPVIFISSDSAPENIGAAIEAGGDDYLVKPLNRLVLSAKLLAMDRIVAMKSVMASALPDYVNRELQRLTELDDETGLANRHGLERGLAREYARCARTSQPIGAILAQVESQDRIVDTATVVKKIAAVFKSHVARSHDLASHLGDDRFCIILPDTPHTGALHIAERIRGTLAELHDFRRGEELPVRLGVATLIPESGHDPAALLDMAGGALEQARQKNIFCAGAESTPFRLTPRELECLQWCALGKTTWEIGQLLDISEAAVNFHMTNIRSKCDVNSRRQAVTKAIQLGLIRPPR